MSAPSHEAFEIFWQIAHPIAYAFLQRQNLSQIKHLFYHHLLVSNDHHIYTGMFLDLLADLSHLASNCHSEIDPPKDLKTFLYRCDDHFHVDILKDMLKDDNLIGFLAIDAKDAGWGLLHGDRIDVLSETGSGVAGKHRQGGQSAKRFQKLREMELTYYFNRVANVTREYFIDIYQIKGLVISGPGPTKEEFVNGGYLEYRLQNMIIDTIDASYAGSEGVREAFDKAGNILSNFRLVEEKRIVESLFQKINSHLFICEVILTY